MVRLRAFLLLAVALALPGHAVAAPEWQVLTQESTLSFTADESGTPTEGGFGQFEGTILFDPDDLAHARIDVVVYMASVVGGFAALADELKKETWFASAAFPTAHYVATDIAKSADGHFEAHGTLTLRGVSAPVDLAFHFDEMGPKAGASGVLRAVAAGHATVMRTAFGVGQGAWAKTDEVADAVAVTFKITAERPAP